MQKLEIIPAIDILDGKCVRLTQGNYNEVEKFFDNPVEIAKQWVSLGAQRLHIIDLNGAKQGTTINKEIILNIANEVNVDIQVGGGIRSIETIKQYLDNGIKYTILGTKAFEDKDFLKSAVEAFNERIILGLDLKNGQIALSGWSKTIETDFSKLANEISCVKEIILTDISKDGMLKGPNLDLTAEIAGVVTAKIIVSGGLSSLDDIEKIIEIQKEYPNISGVILGKSIYKGTINIKEAFELVNQKQNLIQTKKIL